MRPYKYQPGETCCRCGKPIDPADSRHFLVDTNPSGWQVIRGWIHEDCKP